MARVIFHTPAGIQSYKAHMSFNVTPDPYPNGVTVYEGGAAQDIPRIVNSSYVTIRSTELGAFDAGHGFNVHFSWSGATSGSDYFSYISSSNVISIPVGSQNTSLTEVYCWADGSSPTIQYTITLHGNGGYWGSSSTLTRTVDAGGTFNLGNITAPTRTGNFKLKGWSTSSGAQSPDYTTSAVLTVNSNIELWAFWSTPVNVTIHGNGGVFSGGAGAVATTIYRGDQLQFSGYTPTYDGYKLTGWSKSATGGATISPTGVYTVLYTDGALDFYAHWKTAISKFYWHGSDAADSGYFQTGENIASAITASSWNNLQDKVYELFNACGASGSYTKQTAQPSGTIYAYQYNNTVNGLQAIKTKLSSSRRIPSTVTSDVTIIIPSQWNGESTLVASLKSALNHLIDDWG